MPLACCIRGFGAYVPKRILTNGDLTAVVDTSDEWIVARTGIRQRHILADGERVSDAGAHAAREALAEAGLAPSAVTHLLFGTCTPDCFCPSTACIAADKLGLSRHVAAYDFNAACSGFLYGLLQSRALLAAEPDAHVLLICAEGLSRRLNWQDRSTCVLFGDGAGAVVCSGGEEGAPVRLEDVICATDASLRDLIRIGGGSARSYAPDEAVGEDFFLSMQGREVFKHAVRNMAQICRDILDRNSLSARDVHLLVPHQANMRIIEAVSKRLDFPEDRVFTNVAGYGNTSAASVPLALYEARKQGRMPSGTRVLMATFGAGLTWAAGLLRAQ
ncbi:MAG: ketoacyl-ACP synthase III [Deltaproteobacteria bacterium]|jgi:3-oxoacyl-[acyl-carrier-protein] synthase-3|nr:ketoacyl-ACP synthase III [Deltaproteobacteria bacterium]